MNASFSGVSRDTDQGLPVWNRWRQEENCGSLVKAQASARLDVPTAPVFFLQCGPRRPTRVQVFANAWTRACQATDRDLERVNAVKKVNAWICALLATDRDPASVIPDKKRTSSVFFHKVFF